MASAPPSSAPNKETNNYSRLCRLLVDVRSQALRDTFDNIHPPADLHEVLTHPPAHPLLQSLRKKRILNPTQWGKLYPIIPSSLSSANFDITLLILLLKNICDLSPPATGWSSPPPDVDTSIEGNIARLLYYRNIVYGHASHSSVEEATFNSYWQEISNALVGLGAGPSYWNGISRLKDECMDPDFEKHYQELLREWKKDDDNIKDQLGELEGMKKKQKGDDNRTDKLEEKKGTDTEENKKHSSRQCNEMLPGLSIKLPKLSELSKISKPWSDAELPIDILLLTVEDCEFLSCLYYLDKPFKSYCKETGYVYFGSTGSDDQQKLKIALMKCSKGSVVPGGSLTVLKNAVRVLRPKAVFSVGACIGLNSEKTRLGDVVVSCKLTTSVFKIPVSKDIGNIVRNVAEGWQAPVEDPDVLDVSVHCGDVLSQPQVAKFGWRHEDIIEHYPEAIAVETEGEGVFAAAYDDKMEWVIVKGVAGYGNLRQSSSDDWMSFAGTMAASLVANILRDAVIFQEWPHYNPDAFNPAEFIDGFRQLYKTREGWLTPFPWCEGFQFHLDNIFTRLKMVTRKKERGTKTDDIVDMFDIFKPHEECTRPRTILIEAKPGMGKTTYCNKLAFDWATRKRVVKSSFPNFRLVLLLKCRDINSGLWEAIDDQLLPLDVKKEEREEFFKFICHNQSNVLLILDGLDELPSSKLQVFKEIIRRRMLPKCHLVVTARHEAGIKVRECCDTLLEVEGFTEEDARMFIVKYFKGMEDLSQKLLDKLKNDEQLRDISANPLNAALLCLLCEDFRGIFPESRTQLYLEIVQCVLRRYRKKNELPETNEDLIEVYKAELKLLGSIALNGLLEDNPYFENRQLENLASDLPGFGFLSVQRGSSKRKPSICYGFLHKSFQELFAAFYLCCQLIDGEICPESLVGDTRYFLELKQVLFFTCGMLAARCEENAVALIKCITSQVNKGDADDFVTALHCISECKKEQSNLHRELARVLGSLCKIQSLDLNYKRLNAAALAVLAKAIKTNSTLTELDLSYNGITYAGAAALAKAIQTNSTLTVLNLAKNDIGYDGAAALAEAIQTNSTLTVLNLDNNEIGCDGVAALAKAIQTNSTLTELNLSYNRIADTGVAALAKAIQTNSTLTELDLSTNEIADAGAVALAEAIQTNSTLTELNLCYNYIADVGAVALAEAIQRNSTPTELRLGWNEIGDAGAAALAGAIQTNSTLTVLNLEKNDIGYDGAAALAEAIQTNSTLTELNLSANEIGDAAAALAEAMIINSKIIFEWDSDTDSYDDDDDDDDDE